MLHSMTGFGRSETQINNYHVIIDIRSLNGKQLEINTRIPLVLKPFDLEIKSTVQQLLHRGTIEVNINLKQHGVSKPMQINTELAQFYYQGLKQISEAINEPITNPLTIIMAMPEVVSQSSDELAEADVQMIMQCLKDACNALNAHRSNEGAMLENYLKQAIGNIVTHGQAIVPFEAERIVKQKEKLTQLLNEHVGEEHKDKNRLEQEIIYYLEKLDINEEKSRLQHHIHYFEEILNDTTEIAKGKKLGFVLQEFGREINTMGSKANHASIQKLVVQMKDELEKAKEQVLNVL
jgi:uncharacterized protein (TIGR00255 family)